MERSALASVFTVGLALVVHGIGLVALAAGALVLFPKLRRL